MEGFYLSAARGEISQGDVFSLVPTVMVSDLPLTVLKKKTFGPGETAYESIAYVPGQAITGKSVTLSGELGDMLALKAHLTRAVVLSHDCNIDNDPKHRLLALIRPFNNSQSEKSKQIISENGNFSFFYMPETTGLPEGYVDFRRLTTVGPALLPLENRITSLSDAARDSLIFIWFRYISRLQVDADKLSAFMAKRE